MDMCVSGMASCVTVSITINFHHDTKFNLQILCRRPTFDISSGAAALQVIITGKD